ncbi:hypothetical protein [Nostoc sp. MG11]|uniref:hypothetical protein n=1 Tax=Nostoc sp. MG11 TaxID=2721166 RepID=UPI0018675754|nr:hypothetical protein [Nostoc sp. MG11]
MASVWYFRPFHYLCTTSLTILPVGTLPQCLSPTATPPKIPGYPRIPKTPRPLGFYQ